MLSLITNESFTRNESWLHNMTSFEGTENSCFCVCTFWNRSNYRFFSCSFLLSQATITDTQSRSEKEKGNALNELNTRNFFSIFSFIFLRQQSERKKAKSWINIREKWKQMSGLRKGFKSWMQFEVCISLVTCKIFNFNIDRKSHLMARIFDNPIKFHLLNPHHQCEINFKFCQSLDKLIVSVNTTAMG